MPPKEKNWQDLHDTKIQRHVLLDLDACCKVLADNSIKYIICDQFSYGVVNAGRGNIANQCSNDVNSITLIYLS